MNDLLTMSGTRRQLRDYQAEAIERLRDSLRAGHKRPILQAPTGMGKTVVASAVVRMAREKEKSVVFTVPALSLIDQTLESFRLDGINDIGVIQAKHHATDWTQPVQIASVQTLEKRNFPLADLVIVDEAHRVFSRIATWMAECPDVPFIGLSATPWTKGLGKLYDDLIVSATTRELIERGDLCRYRVFAPAHPDLSGVKIVAGDYHEGQLSETMNTSPLVADVVETWTKLGEGRPTLVFGVDRAHAKSLQAQFHEAGINAGYQDMMTDDGERAALKRGFHNGHYPVVCNVGTLTTGVDWDVRCIVLARPTRSEILYVQIIGRGLRTAPGKADLMILDHSDTAIRLGLPDEIHHDTLDDGKKKVASEKKAILPKECPQCHYLMAPKVTICPACGHKRVAQSQVEHVEGELVELTGAKAKRPLTPRPRIIEGCVEIAGQRIPVAEFFAELRGYQVERGYANGWAANQYREKTGVWPNFHIKDAEPLDPSPVVRSFIKSRLIAYAKARRA
jgi:DNA repair protein RadD